MINGSLHMRLRSPYNVQCHSKPKRYNRYSITCRDNTITFKYAIVNNGSSVNGTKYRSAGWAALNTSELTVAVSSPRKYLQNVTK